MEKLKPHVLTDYGIHDYLELFSDIIEKLLSTGFDVDTMHDIKNRVCYLPLAAWQPANN